jgi:hypothetical protein
MPDQPEHAVRGRVLGAHVDDDVVVALVGDPLDDGVPVLAGDREDPARGGVGPLGVRVVGLFVRGCHQL